VWAASSAPQPRGEDLATTTATACERLAAHLCDEHLTVQAVFIPFFLYFHSWMYKVSSLAPVSILYASVRSCIYMLYTVPANSVNGWNVHRAARVLFLFPLGFQTRQQYCIQVVLVINLQLSAEPLRAVLLSVRLNRQRCLWLPTASLPPSLCACVGPGGSGMSRGLGRSACCASPVCPVWLHPSSRGGAGRCDRPCAARDGEQRRGSRSAEPLLTESESLQGRRALLVSVSSSSKNCRGVIVIFCSSPFSSSILPPWTMHFFFFLTVQVPV